MAKTVPKSKRIARLKKKVDIALQNYYRTLNMQCSACENQATVMHHHVPKSRSNFLRYDGRNLVPLCAGCHYLHHQKGTDPNVSFKYRKLLDEDYLMENQHTYKKWEEDELKELLESFKN